MKILTKRAYRRMPRNIATALPFTFEMSVLGIVLSVGLASATSNLMALWAIAAVLAPIPLLTLYYGLKPHKQDDNLKLVADQLSAYGPYDSYDYRAHGAMMAYRFPWTGLHPCSRLFRYVWCQPEPQTPQQVADRIRHVLAEEV